SHHQAPVGDSRHLRLDRRSGAPHPRSPHRRPQVGSRLRHLSRRRPPQPRETRGQPAGSNRGPLRPAVERTGTGGGRRRELGRVQEAGSIGRPLTSPPSTLSRLEGGPPADHSKGRNVRRHRWTGLVAMLALIAAACGGGEGGDTTAAADTTPETTPETTATTTDTTPTTVTETTTGGPTIGTLDDPIQVLFVPSVSATEIVEGGELL